MSQQRDKEMGLWIGFFLILSRDSDLSFLSLGIKVGRIQHG